MDMATVKRGFSAVIWLEDDWYIAQCLEVDVASQGRSREEALDNLREALELYFEDPRPGIIPEVVQIDAEVYAP